METSTPSSAKCETLVFDIETDGLLDEVTTIHCIVAQNPESGETSVFHDDPGVQPRDGSVSEGLLLLQEARVLIGHNILGFDIPAIAKVSGLALQGAVHDTAVMSRLVYSDRKERDFALFEQDKLSGKYIGQHSLGSWGQRLGNHKGDYDGGWENFSQEMLDYCIQDVNLNVDLYKVLKQRLPDFETHGYTTFEVETKFAKLCEDMQRVGVPFDKGAADRLLGVLLPRRVELEAALQEAFPPKKVYYKKNEKTGKRTRRRDADGVLQEYKLVPFEPGSRMQLAARLRQKYEWVPSKLTKQGKPSMVEEILLDIAEDFPEAKLAAELYVVNARIGILERGSGSYLRLLTEDSRIHNRTLHIGTVTHRCSHSKPNLGNPTSVRKPYGKEIRRLFVPLPGYEFVGGDASGLELRMLAHYLGKWDGGVYAETVDKGDPHSLHMHAIRGGSGVQVDRDATKTLGYAWLYGAGDAKLGRVVGAGPSIGRKIRASLRSQIEGMDPLLRGLERATRSGSVYSLDKRRVGVRHEHAALNSLLQAAGAVVMKWFPVFLEEELASRGVVWFEDFVPHLHVHDELDGSVRPGMREPVEESYVAAFHKVEEALSLRVPLRCDVKFGDNWMDVH